MRRAAIVLGLASSAVAVVIVVLFYGIGFHRPTVAPGHEEAKIAQQTSSVDREAQEPTAVVESPRASDGHQEPAIIEAPSDEYGFIDEDTWKGVRERATHDVQMLYSFLIEHLELTPSEKDALLSLLIEDQIEGTTIGTETAFSRGRTIDKEEQSNRIAAIIGESKLQQFLELQRDLGSFTELAYITSALERHTVPITEAQRDRLLEILIEVQDQELALPGADAEKGTIEYLEYLMAKTDERERLIFEQAASILSAEQVGYLFEQYQHDSYRRADALERQKKARANNDAEDLPLYYPGRSDPGTPQ